MQYNTCFWSLVKSGLTGAEAQDTLKVRYPKSRNPDSCRMRIFEPLHAHTGLAQHPNAGYVAEHGLSAEAMIVTLFKRMNGLMTGRYRVCKC